MGKNEQQSAEPQEMSATTVRRIALLAVAVALAPHFFFAAPFDLHMSGQTDAFFGIAVWAPAILAGFAFFFGADMGARIEPAKLGVAERTAAWIVALVAFALFVALRFETQWTDMESMRPWGELKVALPLYAVLGGLEAVFWQGFVQHRALGGVNPVMRVAALAALTACVWLPFAASTDLMTVLSDQVAIAVAAGALAAMYFESGATLRTAVLLRAMMGLALVWFRQAVFL